jgi:glycosyltransferase involved in cell wall biosynthesis
MKVHILFSFHEGPYGGGNQFLKALKKSLKKFNIYEENIKNSDVILFNSHHEIGRVIDLKVKHPNKIFIHRIDGPIHSIRDSKPYLDFQIYKLNFLLADGTIFQSEWSKKRNIISGLRKNRFETVIMNAPDGEVFFPENKTMPKLSNKDKCHLIAVSWSDNTNKGFDLYKFLDNRLDFNLYNMSFVGNSPILFKNIKIIGPQNSYEIAKLLRESDIYIIGSKNDPCSNSLIEALSCGLPCVALNDGGHPEILRNGGEIFNTFEDCLEKIQLIKENYEKYMKKVVAPNIEDISNEYVNFIQKIYTKFKSNKYEPKKVSKIQFINLTIQNLKWNIQIFGFLTYIKRLIKNF